MMMAHLAEVHCEIAACRIMVASASLGSPSQALVGSRDARSGGGTHAAERGAAKAQHCRLGIRMCGARMRSVCILNKMMLERRAHTHSLCILLLFEGKEEEKKGPGLSLLLRMDGWMDGWMDR